MSYATQSDLNSTFGAQNIIEWGNFIPGAVAADASRIALAQSIADETINTALMNGPYAVPIEGTAADPPVTIVGIAAILAGYWLWDTRNLHKTKEIQMEMQRKYNQAVGDLSMIQLGRLPIQAAPRVGRSHVPRVRTAQGWK